jgi:hypothetical protein
VSDQLNRKQFLGLSAGALTAFAAQRKSCAAYRGDNPITVENSKAGTTNWEPTNQAQQREIEGYANKTSVGAGQTISFFVNTASTTYTIDIYRIGWYGGAGGRLMRSSGARTGVKQTIPTPNATTGLCECRWTAPWTITLPTGASAWTSGYYLAKITTKEGKQSHIPFNVRDDARVTNFLVVSPVNRWQAYNNWGGKSLYEFNSTNGKRAYKVSFNRPYDAYGSNCFYNPWSGWELNTLRFFEREGYDVKYCTNVDLHEDPNRYYRSKSLISTGHDEYWSKSMRDNIEYIPNERISLGFFGANAAYWQVRYEAGAVNGANRTLVCYKDATLDPNALSSDPNVRATTTGLWREVDAGGYTRPEASIIGVQYRHFPVNADMIVKNTSYWLFGGTGLKDGDRLTGMVGYEADELAPSSPQGIFVLAETPVNTQTSGAGFHHMTMFDHPSGSGAIVFATGSHQWAWGLDSLFSGIAHPNLVNPAVQQITRNVLAGFASK